VFKTFGVEFEVKIVFFTAAVEVSLVILKEKLVLQYTKLNIISCDNFTIKTKYNSKFR
jgi:hypothetical protein